MANNKDKYGEVFTPLDLVKEMRDLLCGTGSGTGANNIDYIHLYDLKHVVEPGAGKGIFYKVCRELFQSYAMCEINSEHFDTLHELICDDASASLIEGDYLTYDACDGGSGADLVLGNLPFNMTARKFVPHMSSKTISGLHVGKNDEGEDTWNKGGKTLWTSMVHHTFEHVLRPGGFFFCIIPCIWLKPDRAGIYELFTKTHKIHALKIYDCVTANKMFDYNCQTPICYVLVQKRGGDGCDGCDDGNNRSFRLYDMSGNTWVHDFQLRDNYCIPTSCIQYFQKAMHIQNKCLQMGQKWTSLGDTCVKINSILRPILQGKSKDYVKGSLSNVSVTVGTYKIITGAVYDRKTNVLGLNGFVGTVPGLYYGRPKVILPHKRLAKFIVDYDGTYGLLGRDMYVWFLDEEYPLDNDPVGEDGDMDIDMTHVIRKRGDDYLSFFNQSWVQDVMTIGFRIRMNFIEKYPFYYLPDPVHTSYQYYM
jgi:hypothetical protein